MPHVQQPHLQRVYASRRVIRSWGSMRNRCQLLGKHRIVTINLLLPVPVRLQVATCMCTPHRVLPSDIDTQYGDGVNTLYHMCTQLHHHVN